MDDLSLNMNSLSLREASFLGLPAVVEVEEWDFEEGEWYIVDPETHRSPDADQQEYRIEETEVRKVKSEEEGDFCKVTYLILSF